MANLVGIYEIENANLYPSQASDFHLVISKRHKASARKPREYLLLKQAGRFIYISSLYPQSASDAQNWQFDWQGSTYLLTLDRAENKAEIRSDRQRQVGRSSRSKNQNT
jgi:hypothetical protein